MNGGGQPQRVQYLDSGAIFESKNRKNDKSPTHYCKMTLSEETLQKIIAANGKVQISGWTKNSQFGQFLSIKISADDYSRDEQSVQPQANTSSPKPQVEAIDDDVPF